jgi:hypothetical protein
MASPTIDLVGTPGDRNTQGLGRLTGQFVPSVKLVALLRGILELGQDMELLLQKLGRYLNPVDDATQATANTDGAVGAQLLAIGAIVGVSNVVPGPTGQLTLTDAQYLKLILARIYRNHVKGGTLPQLLEALQIVMPDLTTSDLVRITEIGHMTTLVAVGREVEAWEAGIFNLTSGVSMSRGAVLPRPTGVSLSQYWWADGCFTFALESDVTTLEDPNGVGFNTTESATVGIGRWAEDF